MSATVGELFEVIVCDRLLTTVLAEQNMKLNKKKTKT